MLDFKEKISKIVGSDLSIENIVKILGEEPYFLKVKYNDTYGLLKYDRSTSNLSNDFVKQCRGLVFRLDNLEIVNHTLDMGMS